RLPPGERSKNDRARPLGPGSVSHRGRIPYLFKPHRLLLKKGPMMGLSPTGPAIFLLHSRMLGSGSSGRAALALASTGSAFLLLSIRTLSSRLLSVLSSSGSTSGMFTRPQFWPENLGAWGM